MLELVEARDNVASTIFCSQYDTSEWHENLYDPTQADAICDRIIYNAYTIQIEGSPCESARASPNDPPHGGLVHHIYGIGAPLKRRRCAIISGQAALFARRTYLRRGSSAESISNWPAGAIVK